MYSTKTPTRVLVSNGGSLQSFFARTASGGMSWFATDKLNWDLFVSTCYRGGRERKKLKKPVRGISNLMTVSLKLFCKGHFKSHGSVSQTISWITFYHNHLKVIKIQIQGSSQDYDPGCFRWSSQPHNTALQGQSVKQMSSTNWATWHLKYSGWDKVGSQPLITGRLREAIFKERVRLRLALSYQKLCNQVHSKTCNLL